VRAAFESSPVVKGARLGEEESEALDVALLNQETLAVKEATEAGPVAFTLPVAELLWFLSPDGHLAGAHGAWVTPDEDHPLAFQDTGMRAEPTPNVRHQA
jgi:hypothetical protein